MLQKYWCAQTVVPVPKENINQNSYLSRLAVAGE